MKASVLLAVVLQVAYASSMEGGLLGICRHGIMHGHMRSHARSMVASEGWHGSVPALLNTPH